VISLAVLQSTQAFSSQYWCEKVDDTTNVFYLDILPGNQKTKTIITYLGNVMLGLYVLTNSETRDHLMVEQYTHLAGSREDGETRVELTFDKSVDQNAAILELEMNDYKFYCEKVK
jgi:hypothetical protein